MSRFLILFAIALAFTFNQPARAQREAFGGARSLVERVQEDLRHAGTMRSDGKERERFVNAEHSLSEFDRDLSRNKFDKGKLDNAIRDVRNVVDHNTLTPDGRDALTRDLEDLRILRERRGAAY
jgi:hypothetical protein